MGAGYWILVADPAREGRSSTTLMSVCRSGRAIPSFFILAIKVVRFNPSLAAAPVAPPMIHPAVSSVSKIKARSESFRVRSSSFAPIGARHLWAGGYATDHRRRGSLRARSSFAVLAHSQATDRPQRQQSFCRNLVDALSHAPGKDLDVMQDERRNIPASLPERR